MLSLYWRAPITGISRMVSLRMVAACLGLVALAASVPAAADSFRLGNNQRISCGRGLSAGKLSVTTCKSFAYLFNTTTSEYFRCSVSLELTRNNKEVLNVQTAGSCKHRPRIFPNDSSYTFEATETEPPNTNAFFGPGGYAVWASDTAARKVRGCIVVNSGLGEDVTRCVDMTFE
jgi:hypothetical protein